jgi:molybdopterin-binding protein
VHVDADVPLVAEITVAAVGALGIHEGVPVHAAVKATEVSIYPS